MPRILIVSAGHLSRNPRIVKEAETLGRAGHEVTVLAVRNHAPAERNDLELLRQAPYQRVVVDLLGAENAFGPARLKTWFARRLGRPLGWQSPLALGPVSHLLALAEAHPADLTLVHAEAAFWVGRRLLWAGRKVAADFEDWHSEDLLPADRAKRPLKLLRALESELLQHAVYTSTTSHALADALHARYGGKRPIVLTNSFPLQANPRTKANEPPAFFWFSQTLGPGRGLESFLAAWARSRAPSRVVLLGEELPGYRASLLARVPSDRRDAISFLPLVPPADLPALIAQYDIGLALEQSDIVNRDLTITNKILQYLNAGLAVVASATAGQREVFARAPGVGLLVDPRETMLFSAALDSLLSDPIGLAQSQQAARRAAAETYCWEREAPTFLAAIDAALANRNRR